MEKISELTEKLGKWGSIGLGIVLGLGLGYLCYSFWLEPYANSIAQKQVTTETKELSVAQLGVIEKEHDLVIEKGAGIYANYLKGAELLPSGEQVSEVLEAIQGKAGANGTQVISFDAFKLGNASGAAPAVFERVVEGELRGDHNALVGFLRAISYYNRITEVRAISAQKDDRGGGERLKFVLAAYYLPTQIDVPPQMRERAAEILKKEGFVPNETRKIEKETSTISDNAVAPQPPVKQAAN